MSNTWGCPDWRDADAYPASGDELQGWQWRWEFLRRSKIYRAVSDGVQLTKGKIPGILKAYIITFWDMPEYVDPRTHLTSDPFTMRGGGERFYFPRREFIDHYFEFDPDTRWDWIVDDLETVGLLVEHDDVPPVAYFCIDLTRPLKPQLSSISDTAKQLTDNYEGGLARSPRLDRKLWTRHLRVIDAVDQGASDTEIFEQFQTELVDDIEAYDGFGGDQPLVMIADWKKAAQSALKKIARYL